LDEEGAAEYERPFFVKAIMGETFRAFKMATAAIGHE
jgi:hypothetical protein